MQNVLSKPSAARVNFCWLGKFVGLKIRSFLSQMAHILSSLLYQAVRGKVILEWVTFPGYVTLPIFVKFIQTDVPSVGMVIQPGYCYLA